MFALICKGLLLKLIGSKRGMKTIEPILFKILNTGLFKCIYVDGQIKEKVYQYINLKIFLYKYLNPHIICLPVYYRFFDGICTHVIFNSFNQQQFKFAIICKTQCSYLRKIQFFFYFY